MTRLLIVFLALVGLTACETVGGAGKDIQHAGDAITDAAEDAQ